jgi:DHA2 family multidrug resistance protein-like MFS transporter
MLPEYKDPHARPLDIRSAAMSLLAILAVIYGLKEMAQDGVSAEPLVAIAFGVILGALFVRRQLTLASPLIDVRLFRIPAFTASLGSYLLGIFVAVGFFIFVAQYLQLVLGLSPFVAALWSLPSFVGFTVGSVVSPKLVHRYRASTLMGGGLALAAIGAAIMLGLRLDDAGISLGVLTAASLVMSLGLSPVVMLATELIVGSAPPEQAGAATGMSETSGELGGALGIAILGSLGTALYRRELAQEMPARVPAPVADVARDTLGGAMEVARTLPGDVAGALIATAHSSFLEALQLVAAVTAVVALLAAIGAAYALRSVPRRGAQPPAERAAEPASA